SYGRISAVKGLEKKKKITPFYQTPVNYNNPEGFIAPLVYATQAMMRVNPDGTLEWKVEPLLFLEKNLPEIVRQYSLIFQANVWDPQKIGKASQSYEIALTAVQMQLM